MKWCTRRGSGRSMPFPVRAGRGVSGYGGQIQQVEMLRAGIKSEEVSLTRLHSSSNATPGKRIRSRSGAVPSNAAFVRVTSGLLGKMQRWPTESTHRPLSARAARRAHLACTPPDRGSPTCPTDISACPLASRGGASSSRVGRCARESLFAERQRRGNGWNWKWSWNWREGEGRV